MQKIKTKSEVLFIQGTTVNAELNVYFESTCRPCQDSHELVVLEAFS